MSDRFRRFVCRAIFLCCCLLPTALVSKWILFPKSVDDWNLQLRGELGVNVFVASIETPTPQVTLLKNVSFEHNNRQCLILPQIKTASVDGQHVISLAQLDICIDDLRQMLTKMVGTIAQNELSAETQIRIARLDLFEKPTFEKSRRATLNHVSIDLQQKNGQTIASIKAYPPGQQRQVVMQIIQSNVGRDTKFNWKLENTGLPIDGWVFGSFYPWMRHCGSDCQFAGIAEMSYQNGSLADANISGILSNIDGETLLQKQFGHGFQGDCQLSLQQCRIINGQIDSMSGNVSCPRGTLDAAFIRNAAKPNLHLTFLSDFVPRSVGFQKLSLNFRIHNGNLYLSGNESGEIALEEFSQSPLLFISHDSFPVPVTRLVKALMPASRRHETVTRETLPLASVLPIPYNQSSDNSLLQRIARESDTDSNQSDY
jgi:hypothetical protein